MNSLDHYPEPVSPTGNIVSEGILNQLGRPDMDSLELLVRESVQNSWDAHVGEQTVEVDISTWMCSGAQFAFLRDEVLREHRGFDKIAEVTSGDSARLLVVRDRGTSGLGGPIRADRAGSDEHRDFVDFLRDIGQPPDKKFGGGTFGYGKTALYLKSRVNTILVHSRCRAGGQLQSRFMAAALGPSFDERGRNYTGRHWWGRIAADGIIDPLLEDEADMVARQLGLPRFEDGERGTTVAVLAPEFRRRTPRQAMHFVVHALLWNFWPKLVEQPGGAPPMRFEVSADGESVAVPSPETVAPFRGLVEAYRGLDESPSSEAFAWVGDLECISPQHHLGRLSLRKFPRHERRLPVLSPDDDGVIPDRCHHVALMRVPELVVKYVEGPALNTDMYEYGGVFRAARDMDRVYAKSEPPSHDDWVNRAMEDWSEKRYVGSTFLRIDERLDEFAGPGRPDAPGDLSGGASLGPLGEQLGELLPGLSDSGVEPGPGRGGGGSHGGRGGGSRRASVEVKGSPGLVEVAGRAALEVAFEVHPASGSGRTEIRANPYVVLDSGEREREAPAGLGSPEVLQWSIAGRSYSDMTRVEVHSNDDGDPLPGRVRVSIPADATVGVELTASTVGD